MAARSERVSTTSPIPLARPTRRAAAPALNVKAFSEGLQKMGEMLVGDTGVLSGVRVSVREGALSPARPPSLSFQKPLSIDAPVFIPAEEMVAKGKEEMATPTAKFAIEPVADVDISGLNAELHLVHDQWLELGNTIQKEPKNYVEWIIYRNSLPEKLARALIAHEEVTRPFQRGRLTLALMNKLRGGEPTRLYILYATLLDSVKSVSGKYPSLRSQAAEILAPTPKKPSETFHCYSAGHSTLRRLSSPEEFREGIALQKVKLAQVVDQLKRNIASYERQTEKMAAIFNWDSQRVLDLTGEFLDLRLTSPQDALTNSTLQVRLKDLFEEVLNLEDFFASYLVAAKELPTKEEEPSPQEDILGIFNRTYLSKLESVMRMPPIPKKFSEEVVHL